MDIQEYIKYTKNMSNNQQHNHIAGEGPEEYKRSRS